MDLVRRQGGLKHRKCSVPRVHEHFEHSANVVSGPKAHFERASSDKDFYHTIHLTEKPHNGIIVIALRQPNTKAILVKLDWVLKNPERFDFENECILLTDSKCTVYK